MAGAEKKTASKPSAALEKTASTLQKAVDEVVHHGVGPMVGSAAYAEARLGRQSGNGGGGRRTRTSASGGGVDPDVEAAIRRIIRESVAAAGTTGFVTGVGGLVTLPVTLPVNFAGNMIINARMVGAIAYLRGYELDDPHTEAMLLLTVAGSGAQATLSKLGVTVGQEVAKQAIQKVPIAVIREINKKAGFYLLAKYGTQRAAVTMAKAVPIAGGVVGGSIDAGLTRSIGSAAKKVFPAD